MKGVFLGGVLTAVLFVAAYAARSNEIDAPDFKAQASLAGKSFEYSLRDALKRGAVVVYFYPSAYTGGCNLEAHTFAENSDKFAAAGASVIGVSLDDIERLNDFSADPQYCAGKVPVASDADGRIAKAYGVSIREVVAGKKDTRGIEIGHGFTERTTFVIGRDGKIAATLRGLKPEEHVAKALDVVQGLAASE